jgi:hypothetical protein
VQQHKPLQQQQQQRMQHPVVLQLGLAAMAGQ